MGALIMRSKCNPMSLLTGGDQEEGYRSGTNDVPGAIMMAKALEINNAKKAENLAKVTSLMAILEDSLKEMSDLVHIESPANHCPYIVDFSFTKHKASVIVEALSEHDIYLSSVSACNSKSEPISYVLEAMGRPMEVAANAIRLSISPRTTEEEIHTFIDTLKQLLKEVRPR